MISTKFTKLKREFENALTLQQQIEACRELLKLINESSPEAFEKEARKDFYASLKNVAAVLADKLIQLKLTEEDSMLNYYELIRDLYEMLHNLQV